MTNNGMYKNEPRPRLCHLRRWPDFVGYGFNLHCEKAKPGQFIGKVDPESPAESAGLRENDRILEVNFIPIGNENHKQVVARIKEGVTRNGTKYPEEVILLVLDQDADEYYKSKSHLVKSSDANVLKLETENRNGLDHEDDSSQSSNKSDSYSAKEQSPPTKSNESNRDYNHVTDFTSSGVKHITNKSSPAISRTSDQGYEPPEDHRTSPPSSDRNKHKEFSSNNAYTNINPSPKSSVHDFRVNSTGTNSPRSSPSANGSGGVLELHMSAAEYREKLKAQNARKRDPRQNQNMSMKEKHDFIDRL